MADSSLIYWDACMFFEWLGQESPVQERRDGLQKVLKECDEGSVRIMTSVATHLEVVPDKLDDKHSGASQKYEALFDGGKFIDVEISRNIVNLARHIRNFYFKPAIEPVPAVPAQKATEDSPGVPGKPRIPGQPGKMMDMGDSIHLATAIVYGATEFHTRDGSNKKSKVGLLGLPESSPDGKICGVYPLKVVSPLAEQYALELKND